MIDQKTSNKENNRDRFVRIVERRVNIVLNNLDSLGKCSNKKNYEYTDKDVKKIFNEIEKKSILYRNNQTNNFKIFCYVDGGHPFIFWGDNFINKKENEGIFKKGFLNIYGISNGDTAISRTVALPAAIAVKMILEEKINITGVKIPVIPEIYNPILDELEEIGINFSEKTNAL